MNLAQLILKNLRQRALSTWLTLASVALGTALAVALLVVQREADALVGQGEFGYDLVVSAKGSPLQATFNNAFLLGDPVGTFEMALYDDLTDGEYAAYVADAVPLAWGDTHRGRRIVATTTALFDGFEPRRGRPVTMAEGRAFEDARWQAVLGSDAADALDAGVGYEFSALHGNEQTGHVHEEAWTVVGVMARTYTALDKAIYVPIETAVALGEHAEGLLDQLQYRRGPEEIRRAYEEREAELDRLVEAGGTRHEAYVEAADGAVVPATPREFWGITGVLVATRGGIGAANLRYALNNGPRATAAVPAQEMRAFLDDFLAGPTLLFLLVTALVTVVAALGILVSIYNSVAARRREVAILRSLGATRGRVLALVVLEATLIGLAGAVLGLLGGHALAAAVSGQVARRLGQGIDWWAVGGVEWAYLGGVVVLAGLAGLVPALKAYATPVAQNLSE